MTVKSMALEQVKQSVIDDKTEILSMFDEACSYMLWHTWCKGIEKIHFEAGFAHLAIFFVTIYPEIKNENNDYWVIVGDVPPLYLDTADGTISTPADALEAYCYVMDIWVEAALGVGIEDDIPPVVTRKKFQPIKPTKAYADMLAERLEFLRSKVIPAMRR